MWDGDYCRDKTKFLPQHGTFCWWCDNVATKNVDVFVWAKKVRLNGLIHVGEDGQIRLNQAKF